MTLSTIFSILRVLRGFHEVQDTSQALTSPATSDPMVAVVQWMFQKPGWLMLSGLVIGAIVALVALRLIWRHRGAVGTWLTTRSGAVKLLLAAAALAILAVAARTGYAFYDYSENNNNFCRGCHVFIPEGQPYVRPDTGTYLIVNAIDSLHAKQRCHDCHIATKLQLAGELLTWMVDRPELVPKHEKVERKICERCHVQGAARKFWQRIASTGGHRTHLESDSSALKDVRCLSCHAREPHKFTPPDTTCTQHGCHLSDSVAVRLGKMTGAMGLHCLVCHQFTVDVPRLVTYDSATKTLRPTNEQCLTCHEMQNRLAEFDPRKDPHKGTCGMCHNPHVQVKPADALKSCADAGCHDNWRSTAFHVGDTHRRVALRCEACHLPHAASVDASDCVGCHERVRERAKAGIRKPPLPFDTLKALKRSALLPAAHPLVMTATPPL